MAEGDQGVETVLALPFEIIAIEIGKFLPIVAIRKFVVSRPELINSTGANRFFDFLRRSLAQESAQPFLI
jgi:hypothetical protein